MIAKLIPPLALDVEMEHAEEGGGLLESEGKFRCACFAPGFLPSLTYLGSTEDPWVPVCGVFRQAVSQAPHRIHIGAKVVRHQCAPPQSTQIPNVWNYDASSRPTEQHRHDVANGT